MGIISTEEDATKKGGNKIGMVKIPEPRSNFKVGGHDTKKKGH